MQTIPKPYMEYFYANGKFPITDEEKDFCKSICFHNMVVEFLTDRRQYH